MSSAEEVVLAAAACVILSKCRKPRRYWVRPSLQARAKYSGSDLLNYLNRDDTDPSTGELRCDGSVKNFLRMSSDDFESSIVGIGHIISKQDTNYRKAIPVRERLAITLRFLASGDSYTSISYLFKVSKSAISILVPEICEAVIGFLKDNIQVMRIGRNVPEAEQDRNWPCPSLCEILQQAANSKRPVDQAIQGRTEGIAGGEPIVFHQSNPNEFE